MSNFIRLIGNECRKIFVQKSFIISLVLILIPIIVLGRWEFVGKELGATKEANWKEEKRIDNENIEKELKSADISEPADQQLEKLALNNYRLQHNISPYEQHSVIDFMNKGASITSFIGILLLYFASNMMSKEHQWKTINFLLVKPSTRRMIYYAKFTSLSLLYFIFSLAILIYSFVVGCVINGFDFSAQPVLIYTNHQVIEQSVLSSLVYNYLINLLPFLLFVSIAYFFSTILKSSSISLLISIILFATSDPIAALLSSISWSKYLPFMHTDLTVYAQGINIVNDMHIGFSIFMLIFYTALFLIGAGEVFKKRDVV
ncbi:ABC transporter permease subunit [Bacillus sp. JJ664]